MHYIVQCPLTIVLKSVSVHLWLKRPKSNLASIAQDSALSVADLNSVDLQRSYVRGPGSIVQCSTYEGSICGQILDDDRRGWIVPVPPNDAMFVA